MGDSMMIAQAKAWGCWCFYIFWGRL